MGSLEKRVNRLENELFKITKAEKRLIILDNLSEVLLKEEKTLKAKMRKEHDDVKKLENANTRSLFSSILGGKTQQLEKERQEYLQAVLEYNAIVDEINMLDYEHELLTKVVAEKDRIQADFQQSLRNLEKTILFNGKKESSKIKAWNFKIHQVRLFQRELNEAKRVAEKVHDKVSHALVNLKKVDEFSMYGSGTNSSYAKKQFIDKALSGAAAINYNLHQLDKELSDVYSEYVFFSIYKYQKFIESFIDYLITDWVAQSQLKNATACLEHALGQVERILATIANDIEKGEQEVKCMENQKKTFITQGLKSN